MEVAQTVSEKDSSVAGPKATATVISTVWIEGVRIEPTWGLSIVRVRSIIKPPASVQVLSNQALVYGATNSIQQQGFAFVRPLPWTPMATMAGTGYAPHPGIRSPDSKLFNNPI
jgi:hypothetical protein